MRHPYRKGLYNVTKLNTENHNRRLSKAPRRNKNKYILHPTRPVIIIYDIIGHNCYPSNITEGREISETYGDGIKTTNCCFNTSPRRHSPTISVSVFIHHEKHIRGVENYFVKATCFFSSISCFPTERLLCELL